MSMSKTQTNRKHHPNFSGHVGIQNFYLGKRLPHSPFPIPIPYFLFPIPYSRNGMKINRIPNVLFNLKNSNSNSVSDK